MRMKTKFKVPLSRNSVQSYQGRSESLCWPQPLHSIELSPLQLGRTQTVSPHTKNRILKRLAKSIQNHTSAVSSEIGSPGITLPFDSQQDSLAKYFKSTQQTEVHSIKDTNDAHIGEESEKEQTPNTEFVTKLTEKLKKNETSFFGLDNFVTLQNSEEDGCAKKCKFKKTSKITIKAKSKKANLNCSLPENKKRQKLFQSSTEKVEGKCTSKRASVNDKSISKKKLSKNVEHLKCKSASAKASKNSAQFAKLSKKLQRKYPAAVEQKRKEKIKKDVVRTIQKMHMEIERLLTQRSGSFKIKESKPRDQVESYLFTEE